jgi:membrane protease YdiL (CAAX protease family)
VSPNILLGIVVLAASVLAFIYYAKVARRLQKEGGRIYNGWVGDPDMVLALVVGGALSGLAINGLIQSTKAPQVLKPDQVGDGMLFLAVLAGGVVAFLLIRRLPLLEIFGLRTMSFPRALARGFLLLLAAIPVLLVFGYLTLLVLQDQAKEQELVKLFDDVVQVGDLRTAGMILFAGVIVAPICEELLFRGYFYPVAKRYFGPVTAAFLSATLFAASHINLASLPSLLVLALIFTMAYERTGSLLVPISMHALFNGANLLVLFLRAKMNA